MAYVLQFGFDVLDQLLALDGSAQQRFQRGQQHLGILQGEGSGGHRLTSSLIHRAVWRLVTLGMLLVVSLALGFGLQALGLVSNGPLNERPLLPRVSLFIKNREPRAEPSRPRALYPPALHAIRLRGVE